MDRDGDALSHARLSRRVHHCVNSFAVSHRHRRRVPQRGRDHGDRGYIVANQANRNQCSFVNHRSEWKSSALFPIDL
jgi:hypothetical protein